MRDTLLKKWREDPNNNKKNLTALIFSLNTYQPPLRGETLRMKFEPKLDDKVVGRDYIFQIKDHGNIIWNYYIGKVIKSQRKIKYSMKLSRELSDIINESKQHFPRNWLLSNPNDGSKQMSYSTYRSLVSPYNLNESAFRKSYITYWNTLNPNADIKQKRDLAKQMRHLWSTAQLYYNRKVDDNSVINNIEQKAQELNEESKLLEHQSKQKPKLPQPDIPKKKPGPKSQFNSIEEYTKAYKINNREKFAKYSRDSYNKNPIKQQARAYIRKLNSNPDDKYHIKHPSDSMIEKYNLVRSMDGSWVSNLL